MVVVQRDRAVLHDALLHGLQVLRPAVVVVIADETVPLTRTVVVDLAVRSPERNLILGVEQEV